LTEIYTLYELDKHIGMANLKLYSVIRWFRLKNVRKRKYVKDLSVDGRIILKWLIKTWYGGVDWIDPA
jgi:hypothetical protein